MQSNSTETRGGSSLQPERSAAEVEAKMLSDLIECGEEIAACLTRYQARYAGAGHAKKDHNRSALALVKWKSIFDK
jgi:hypothetical protein